MPRGDPSVADAVAERRAERDRLIAVAHDFARRLSARVPVVAAAVVGSVARGDFNVWSDIDVVVIAEALPERAIEREGLLLEDAPVGVQPVGFTPLEFDRALAKGDRLAREAASEGVPLAGAPFFAERRGRAAPRSLPSP